MADQLQLRRGNSTENASFTGAQGEITGNTETNRLHFHDGVTAGGFPTASTADITNSTIFFDDDTGGGSVADTYVLTPKSNTSTPTLYADGIVLGYVTTNPNTGPSTVDFAGLGIVNVKLSTGEDPAAGDISGRVEMIYDSGNSWFELQKSEAFVSGQYFTGSGPANAYILDSFASSIDPAGLNDRDTFRTSFNADNTGSSTADFSLILGETAGTTVINIKLAGGVDDPVAGDIIAGQELELTYRTLPSVHAELSTPASAALDNLTSQGTTKVFGARAKINGVAGAVIQSNFNIATAVRNSLGNYTLTFTDTLGANITATASTESSSIPLAIVSSPTASSIDVLTFSTAFAAADTVFNLHVSSD